VKCNVKHTYSIRVLALRLIVPLIRFKLSYHGELKCLLYSLVYFLSNVLSASSGQLSTAYTPDMKDVDLPMSIDTQCCGVCGWAMSHHRLNTVYLGNNFRSRDTCLDHNCNPRNNVCPL